MIYTHQGITDTILSMLKTIKQLLHTCYMVTDLRIMFRKFK